MPYQFTVSPDFSPDHLSGWYIFNTWLQKQTGEAIHLEMYDNFQSQRNAIQQNNVDLIYANPYDAAMLVCENGFLPLVTSGIADEAIIAVNADSPIADVAELAANIRVAMSEDPDVRMMGLIMLEPADLNASNISIIGCDSYVLVAKQLLRQDAEVGVFLAEAYDDLSNIIKSKLRILVRSQISVIHHALMIGPKLANKRAEYQQLLLNMADDPKGKDVLHSLGFETWVKVEDEDMEFMIDLMDTLAI